MTLTENPFLTGNYGPVSEECTDHRPRGRRRDPAELRGRYLRIGPNPFATPTGPYHWFIGDGMVHGVELGDGERAPGTATVGCAPTTSRARWARSRSAGPMPPMYDTSNTHVIGHAGRILALTEGAMPYELSPDARHAAPHRLRRSAADRVHRAPEDRSRHRRDARRSRTGSRSRTSRTT